MNKNSNYSEKNKLKRRIKQTTSELRVLKNSFSDE
jgi:hypothetical protein